MNFKPTYTGRFGLLVGLLLLAYTGMVALYVHDTWQLNQRSLLDTSQATRMIELLTLAGTGETHFQEQIQAWKNLLLRGHDPTELERYRKDFDRHEAECQRHFRVLIRMGEALGWPPTIQRQAGELVAQHRQLGVDYRESMPLLVAGDTQETRRADQKMQGRDRELTRLMASVVRQVEQAAVHHLATSRQQAAEVALTFERHLAIFLLANGLLILGSWVAGYRLVNGFRRRSRQIAQEVSRIAAGDLTLCIKGADQKPSDEFDWIAAAINRMAADLARLVRVVRIQADTVDLVNTELKEVQRRLRQGTQEAHLLAEEVLEQNSMLHTETGTLSVKASESSEDVHTATEAVEGFAEDLKVIAAAALEARKNVESVAGTSEVMSVNVSEVNQKLERVNGLVVQVAGAIANLTTALNQVGRQCDTAREESGQVNRLSRQTGETMDKLAASAKDIRQVMKWIGTIADKITMLGLNAGIEAARSGEAGKGFAVVALEVKELARQTGDSTRQIAEKVEEIQARTRETAAHTLETTEGIQRISRSNEEIAESVDTQNHAIQEIARFMEDLSAATRDALGNMAAIGHASREVAQSATEASGSAHQIALTTHRAAIESQRVKESSLGTAFRTSQVSRSACNVVSMAAEIQLRALKLIRRSIDADGSARHAGQLIQVASQTSDHLLEAVNGIQVGPDRFDIKTVKHHYLSWVGLLEEAGSRAGEARTDGDSRQHADLLSRWYADLEQQPLGQVPGFRELAELHRQMVMAEQAYQHLLEECHLAVEQAAARAPDQEEDGIMFFGDEEPDPDPTDQEPLLDEAEIRKNLGEKLVEIHDLQQRLFTSLDRLFQESDQGPG